MDGFVSSSLGTSKQTEEAASSSTKSSFLFDDDINFDEEICRVCRISGKGTLYHPCLCSGSIKFVHQDCLLQWLKYSKKEVCELCNHKFTFLPIYSDDMPEHLPLRDVVKDIFLLFVKFLRTAFMYAFVGFCWLGLVPLIAARTHQIVFSGLLSSIFSTRIFLIFSPDNLAIDISKGIVIMALFVCVFIALVWLREQVNIGLQQDAINIPMARAPENNEPADLQEIRQMVREARDEVRALRLDDEQQPAEAVAEPIHAEEDDEENPENAQNLEQPAAQMQEPANENWGRDVEQIVENMTWQRLLGLDGSFVFIENVFWVVSLNFVFHVTFLLWPSIVGTVTLNWLGLSEQITYFRTPISIFAGYFIIVQGVYLLHFIFKKLQYQQLASFTGVTYLIIKVLLLVIIELVIFPIICGYWLDICSLPLTGSVLGDRVKSFHSFPVSSIVLHWLAGMMYVFYSASFILALRALLRPGVLWFIRNLNDPDFSPINEMIEQPFQKHCRRLVASTTLFLSIIFLVVFCPLRLIKMFMPGLIPYVSSSPEGQFGGFTLEILLLQVVVPTTLEYMKAHTILKYIVDHWCVFVGGWLKLDTYLLSKHDLERLGGDDVDAVQIDAPAGDQNDDAEEAEEIEPEERPRPLAMPAQPNDLAGRHHALLIVHENPDVEPYERPDNFHLRLGALILCLGATLILMSLAALSIPVTIGRLILKYAGAGSHHVQDIYSVAIGFYTCWVLIKSSLILLEWFYRGCVNQAVKRNLILVGRLLLVIIPVIGILPFLLSLYFQLLIIGPLRVSISQTPIFFPAKEWAMGVLHLKIIGATILMAPDFWLKTAMEQVYEGGIRGLRLRTLYVDILFPIVNMLSILIAAPYVAVRTVLLGLELAPEDEAVIIRMSFPCLLLTLLTVLYLKWVYNKVVALYRRLRDDKYLIGTQLVNFYRDNVK